MITQKEYIETTDISKDTFYKLAQIRKIPNKRAGKHNQNYKKYNLIYSYILKYEKPGHKIKL